MAARKDWTGLTVNQLTVIGRLDTGKWLCRCSCGNECHVAAQELRTGQKSCGCAKRDIWKNNTPPSGHEALNRKDVTGERYGRLTMVEYVRTENKRALWRAECDCGNSIIIVPKAARTGNTRSCGCLKRELLSDPDFVARRSATQSQKHRERMRAECIGSSYGRLVVRDIVWRADPTSGNALAFVVCDCECGGLVTARHNDVTGGKTTSCGCQATVSVAESALGAWLSAHVGVEPQYEVDGWRYDFAVPSAKLLIEYNGVYWHSTHRKPNKAIHRLKREVAESHGWRVMTIWSDEWDFNRPRFERLILDACGLGARKTIGARKVNLRPITKNEARVFHDAHHVQGGAMPASAHVGAFLGGELLSVISTSGNTILRMSVRQGFSIPGLLRRFIAMSGAQEWVTYCDRDHFTGAVYLKSGFRREGTTLRMTYADRGVRFPRDRFMKHKLPVIYPDCDLSKTESEICAENGVYQVYNSGIDKWVWRHEPS